MSTKTNFKRIALVAVSALTAGLVSVVAVPAANATAGTITLTTNSVGLLSGSSIVSGTTTTHTATLLSTGTLSLTFGAPTASTVVVSAGATITSASATSAISADQTYAENVTTAAFRPTGAIGSTFTVYVYPETTADTVAANTPDHIMTVTIAGASVAGVVSVADSGVFWTNGIAEVSADTANEEKTTAGTYLTLDIDLEDAYGAAITSTAGALVVTASAGAFVGIGTSETLGTFATAVSGANPSAQFVTVKEATAGAGWSGTITVTYNGVVVATKSGTITGVPAKITVTPKKVGTGVTTGAFEYQVTDSRGSVVALAAASLTMSSSSNEAIVSSAVGTDINSSTAAGTGSVTCVSSASGTSNVVMQTILANGAVVKSNAMAVRCGGQALGYTASWDKASYAQGDVATLTVQFGDSKGNPANSATAVSNALATTSSDIVITANQLERATAYTASMTPDANGQIKFTFTVGTSSGVIGGKYSSIVSFPTVNAFGYSDPTTAGYEVTTGGGITNADVLKAIVSLIASINKQIALLQKALLKK
jgi:hypothetical protein